MIDVNDVRESLKFYDTFKFGKVYQKTIGRFRVRQANLYPSVVNARGFVTNPCSRILCSGEILEIKHRFCIK